MTRFNSTKVRLKVCNLELFRHRCSQFQFH